MFVCNPSVTENTSTSETTFVTPLMETTITSVFGRPWVCSPYDRWCIPLGSATFDTIQLDIGSGWFSPSYSIDGSVAVVVGYTSYCPGFRLVDLETGYENGIKTIYNKYTNSGSGGGC